MWLCCRVLEQRHPAFVQWYRKRCSILPLMYANACYNQGHLISLLKFLY
uniref:Uncharacterized protein n=1 Tax=Anguilla anguilla TaxID=7936 RepID=A0A0E9V3Q2_ANGAN